MQKKIMELFLITKELMKIIDSVGLAQNFAALRSLVSSGIQKGHMRMHLSNILNKFEVSEKEKKAETVGVNFNWIKTPEVSGVGHDHSEMAKDALKYILE